MPPSINTADDRGQSLRLTEQRRAGVCLHLTSLPGSDGIGDLGAAARAFVDQLARAHLSVWQFLPIGPTAYGDSPYQPLSIFAGNPMLIDLKPLLDAGLLCDAELAPLRGLPGDRVDYATLIPQKTQLLSLAATRFAEQGDGEERSRFVAFCERQDARWLHDYALFVVLKRHHNDQSWSEWPMPFRQRDTAALAAFGETHRDEIDTVKFAQFCFARQWQALRDYANRKGVLLFGDMPIYIALDSADAWADGEILKLDADGQPPEVAGVPPDYFSADGQLWGNPLYDWDYHARTGFRWWVERMAHALAQVDIVRIDHFRGFEAYFAIPAGETTARNGEWRTGPNDALFDALREALGETPIVAEDLGVITEAVTALRLRQHMPGMAVLQFMIGEADFSLDTISRDQVCYTGTHDNDTSVGWFQGGPGDTRSEAQIASIQRHALAHTGGDPKQIHWALIETAFASDACLAIAPMQDYLGLGSEARLNTPGVPAGNWQWRLSAGAFDDTLAAKISALVDRYRR